MMSEAADRLNGLDEAFARLHHCSEQVPPDDPRPKGAKGGSLAPYPGLRPFLAEEARFFRGRESQVHEIGDRLARERCISVLGGSGTGKSSIIRAGVIPALRRKLLPGRGDLWRAAIFTPGLEPVENLIHALEGILTPLESRSGRSMEQLAHERQERIRELIYRSDGGIGAFLPMFRQELSISSAISDQAREQANLLIVVDQFEELFREENRGKVQVATLVDLVVKHWRHRDRYPGLYLAMSMRTDDLHRCAEFIELPEFINATSYLTRRLRERELRDAIVGPVRPPLFRAGLLQGEVSPDVADLRPFETEVVTELLDAVEEIGHEPDHLPLLQHLLAVLWRQAVARWHREADQGIFELPPRVTLDDLGSALGFTSWKALEKTRRRVSGDQVPGWLLKRCLERVGNGLLMRDLFGTPLTSQQRAVAQTAFCLMGEIDDRGNVKRRWTNREEIARVAGLDAPNEDVDAVIRRFGSDHRLIWVRSSGEMDVSHEALMRNWPRLVKWLAEDREASLAYLRLTRRCRAWRDANDAWPPWLAPLAIWASWVRKKGRLLGSETLDRLVPALTRRSGRFARVHPRYNSHWAHRYIGTQVGDGGTQDAIRGERENQNCFHYLQLSLLRGAVVRGLPFLMAALLAVTFGLTALQQHSLIENYRLRGQIATVQAEREAAALWDGLRPSYDTVLDDDYVQGLWAASSANLDVRSEFVRQLISAPHLEEIEAQPQAIVRAFGLQWPDDVQAAVSNWLLNELSNPNQHDVRRGANLACASAVMSERLSSECRDVAAKRAITDIGIGEWAGTTPWFKGRILACQGAGFDAPTEDAVLDAIFGTWAMNRDELSGYSLSSMTSAINSAIWHIKADSRPLHASELDAIDELIARVVVAVTTQPSDKMAIIPARSLVSIVAALPPVHQRAALGRIIDSAADLPDTTTKSWRLLILLAQAFEQVAIQHRDQNQAHELQSLIQRVGAMLAVPDMPRERKPINEVVLARLVMPLVEVAGASADTWTRLADLAIRPENGNGAQIALWGRFLALSLHRGSFDSTRRDTELDTILERAEAVAGRGAISAGNLAGEGLARALAAIAEKELTAERRLRAIEVAQQAMAGTGSAEESAAWSTAIVKLVEPFGVHERAATLVEVLKYPTAGFSTREPNARAPANATDILIRALRDAVDPNVEMDWGPGYHLRVLERLKLIDEFKYIDLRRRPVDPRGEVRTY